MEGRDDHADQPPRPKDAKKSYEKAAICSRRRRLREAEKELEKSRSALSK